MFVVSLGIAKLICCRLWIMEGRITLDRLHFLSLIFDSDANRHVPILLAKGPHLFSC